ncbi:glycoside hydrolase family 2 protein [Clavulina sp. PMI_390]|nr:glycoside hydrolase family 2 protein [Clavulina sp. PMI_390]
MSLATKTPINANWEFTQLGGGEANKDGEWLKASKPVTSVHVELLKLKKIPDPFVGLNEYDVQWVGESDWAFRTSFDVSDGSLKVDHADLVFDGLDTYATVELNGKKILETNNMLVSYRVAAKEHLKAGENVLLITFSSTFLKGKGLEKEHGQLGLWNGDSSRLHIRKAGYNYGWDWGPVLMTVGPWKPIYLHTYTQRITDMRITYNVSLEPSASNAQSEGVSITVDVSALLTPSSLEKGETKVEITLLQPDGLPHAKFDVHTASFASSASSVHAASTTTAQAKWDAPTGALQLWYPVNLGVGRQTLYTVRAKLVDSASGAVLDVCNKRVGFRKVRIVQEPLKDEEGRSFFFEVNGVPVFCGGSNWIPADSFLTEISPERYRDWLQLLVDGNQNMVRVWAGGIFEPDVFYDICDELGIMVWQDFLFGCGQYPAYDEFLERVKPEAEQAVVRLRHHASLVILAGNNEDYQVAESLKLELDYADEDPKSDFRKTNFPARHIYERFLPEIVERLSDVYYHRGSPYSGFGKETTDRAYGDLHQWNVWHGSQEPWHNWDKLAGRFVSEFGMQGYPDRRTIDYWTGGEKLERYPQSRTSSSHNKADGFERRLELYLMENFKHAFDMDSYIYYTQVMQAETLASAYRLWRRNWKGPGREYTAGALVWQINDCWPVTSWAIVDYFLRPKPAYYAVSRELRPYTVGMTRKDVKTPRKDKPDSSAYYEIDTRVEIWGTNGTLQEEKVTLHLDAFDLHDATFQSSEQHPVTLTPNQSTELWQGRVPGQDIRTCISQPPRTIIISARLISADGTVLARYANWPEPFKFVHFPTPEEVGLKITVTPDVSTIRLTCLRPIKGVVLDAEGDEDVKWSDSAVDMVPGDEQVILAWGLGERQVKARYLGHDATETR